MPPNTKTNNKRKHDIIENDKTEINKKLSNAKTINNNNNKNNNNTSRNMKKLDLTEVTENDEIENDSIFEKANNEQEDEIEVLDENNNNNENIRSSQEIESQCLTLDTLQQSQIVVTGAEEIAKRTREIIAEVIATGETYDDEEQMLCHFCTMSLSKVYYRVVDPNHFKLTQTIYPNYQSPFWNMAYSDIQYDPMTWKALPRQQGFLMTPPAIVHYTDYYPKGNWFNPESKYPANQHEPEKATRSITLSSVPYKNDGSTYNMKFYEFMQHYSILRAQFASAVWNNPNLHLKEKEQAKIKWLTSNNKLKLPKQKQDIEWLNYINNDPTEANFFAQFVIRDFFKRFQFDGSEHAYMAFRVRLCTKRTSKIGEDKKIYRTRIEKLKEFPDYVEMEMPMYRAISIEEVKSKQNNSMDTKKRPPFALIPMEQRDLRKGDVVSILFKIEPSIEIHEKSSLHNEIRAIVWFGSMEDYREDYIEAQQPIKSMGLARAHLPRKMQSNYKPPDEEIKSELSRSSSIASETKTQTNNKENKNFTEYTQIKPEEFPQYTLPS